MAISEELIVKSKVEDMLNEYEVLCNNEKDLKERLKLIRSKEESIRREIKNSRAEILKGYRDKFVRVGDTYMYVTDTQIGVSFSVDSVDCLVLYGIAFKIIHEKKNVIREFILDFNDNATVNVTKFDAIKTITREKFYAAMDKYWSKASEAFVNKVEELSEENGKNKEVTETPVAFE